MTRAVPLSPPQGGWRVLPWSRAVGVSRSAFYNLLGSEEEPKTVKLGSARIVTESPTQYLARIRKLKNSRAAA